MGGARVSPITLGPAQAPRGPRADGRHATTPTRIGKCPDAAPRIPQSEATGGRDTPIERHSGGYV